MPQTPSPRMMRGMTAAEMRPVASHQPAREQQQRPFVADPNEWEVIDGEDLEVIDTPEQAEARPFSWAEELGMNEPTDSRMVGFLRGAGGAALDMVQGAAAPTAQMIYGGGDLIRRGLGMERVIDRPEVQAAMTAPDSVAGKIGEYGPAVAGAAHGVSTLAKKVIPSAARAGRNFQSVMSVAKDVPINMRKPGDVALRIANLSSHGGGTNYGPSAVRQFINYATDPHKPAMTYEVARDFASNISRLSANEYARMSPTVAREVASLRVALNEAVADAAQQAGKLPEYKAAMREYAQAMRLKNAIDTAVKQAKRVALPAGAAGAGAYWLSREVKSLLGGD